jgi:hypothetical protein
MEKLLNKEDYPVIMLTCRENGMWRLSLEQVGVFSDYFIENEKDLFIDFLKKLVYGMFIIIIHCNSLQMFGAFLVHLAVNMM